MKRHLWLLCLSSALASPLQAETQSSGVAAAQPSAVQQRFNAAEARLNAGDHEAALADFSALERDFLLAKTYNKSSLAIVRVRKGDVLSRLGRTDDAVQALRGALSEGGLDKPALAIQRFDARMLLGYLLEWQLDHAGSAAQYQFAFADASSDAERARIHFALSRVLMFVDAPNARVHGEKSLALYSADAGTEKSILGNVYGVLGRIQLNQNDLPAARISLEKAIKLRGGLDLRVDGADVAIRSDAASVALLQKRDEDARKLFAYTGAGRSDQRLPTPSGISFPQCGGAEDLKVDDMAIIQFQIAQDGTVANAQPVYASRQGEMAYAFARTVGAWSWDSAELAKLPAFYRSAVRVEVRCSNSFTRPSLMNDLDNATFEWLYARTGVSLFRSGESYASEAARLQSELSELTSPVDALKRAGRLAALARNATIGWSEKQQLARQSADLIRAAGGPVMAWLGAEMRARTIGTGKRELSWSNQAKALVQLLDDPQVAADPLARSATRLRLAEAYADAKSIAAEKAVLEQIVNDAGLPEKHPHKIAALVELANVAVVSKNLAEAENAYARTGLSARQCAALDNGPVLLRSNASSADFPDDALRWGFDGWSTTEYDVGADGNTANIRTLVAFPPSVFADAGRRMIGDFRFRPSFRPDGGPGCGARKQTVTFKTPR